MTGGERSHAALIVALSVASGALISNLYYAQPLIAWIARDIGVSPELAGSIVGVAQIGYGVGLLLLVPLVDLVENKMLALTLLSLTIIGLVGEATATRLPLFFVASFIVGLCSTCAQVLLPFIAHLVPEERRGRAVGTVMAGVLTGIMVARPISLLVTSALGWRSIFWASAVLMIAIGITLAVAMPRHRPASGMHYGRILLSMARLLREARHPVRRAVYQALMFGAYCMFWVAAPLMLAERFGLSQLEIALFTLVGAGGALAAPIAGRLADRGFSRATTAGAIIVTCASFYSTRWAVEALALGALAVLAILIDAAIQANQVISQPIIYAVPPEVRGRVNALYVTIAFVGGSMASILGTLTYQWGGWTATASAGSLFALLTLLLFLFEPHYGEKQ